MTDSNYNPANNLDATARAEGGINSGGNFKNNPEHATEAGKMGAEAQPIETKVKGGENSQGSR